MDSALRTVTGRRTHGAVPGADGRATVALVVGLVAGLGTAGCQCELGRNRCAGPSLLERCVEGSDPYRPPHWEKSECFNDYYESPLCVVAPTGNAHCAVEAEPRPDLCPQPETSTGEVDWRCDGARVIGCIDGLVGRARTCGTGTCVVPTESDESFCSILTEPDPLCAEGVWSTCADATTRIQCQEGFRVQQDTCTGAGGCRTGSRATPDGGALEVGLCVLEADVDPNCDEDDVSGQTGYCADGTAINCYLGYPITRARCEGECFDHGYWTECLGPQVVTEGWQNGDPPDCADGFDNDFDGAVDFPDDSDCAAACCGSG